MGHPNEPRLMKPRGNGTRPAEFGQETGNAGRDGYTVVARRNGPGQQSNDDPFPMFGGGNDGINPQVGERDYRRGPRFSEDY
jgi:hypothetical protein